jgi:hypothetical protein
MSPFEMGRVSAFLLKRRRVEEKSDRRAIPKEERDVAELLREAPLDSARFLEELMTGYGFELTTLTSYDIAGIPPGAKVTLLIRRSNCECPLLDASRLAERMIPGKKVGPAKIWFTQIWLMHLDLMYTVRDRGPQERGRWLEAIFTEDQLAEVINEHINGYVRRLNPAEVEQSEVYQVLMGERGQDRARYVKRFLEIMVDSGMLDSLGAGTFRQSLLSAVEMKCNYDRVLGPIMLDLPPDSEDAGLAQTAAALLTSKLPLDASESTLS